MVAARHNRSVAVALPALLVLSCASTGTRAADMTAPQHEAAAASASAEQGRHERQYDPAARAPCLGFSASACAGWTSNTNPTEHHRTDAETYRKLAEKHRAASKALVEAGQRFCAGIPEADRDLSPFCHREDIASVQGVKKTTSSATYGYLGGGNSVVEIQQIEKEALGPGGLHGARVTFRAVPGMTGEWLQRVVDCHLARTAVVGGADMPFCPLAVPRATAEVMSTGSGFAVDIISGEASSVSEIIKRAWALGPGGSTVLK